MNFIDIFLLNLILVSVPILIYMVYITTNRNIDEKEKMLFFSLALISSYFLVMHYIVFLDSNVTAFFLGIIIFFVCLKHLYIISISLMLLTLIVYQYQFFLIMSYLLIMILLFIREKKEITDYQFVILFTISYTSGFFIWKGIIHKQLLETIILLAIFISIIYIIYIFYQKGIETLNSHMKYKELQKEKQIRLSLFKITHEIKNPIAVCKAYLDMYDINNLEHSKKYIPIIRGEIERLLILLQDFLLINKNNMNLDIMDVNMLIEEVKDNIEGLMDSNDINFIIDSVDDELFINGDYNRLSQVLINILKNSIEAEAKMIKIDVKEEKDNLCINIKDDGLGIPQSIINKIYEPFYTTKRCGTGLGVSLSKEIINAHNGTLEYTSKEGNGTNVKIILPSYKEL